VQMVRIDSPGLSTRTFYGRRFVMEIVNVIGILCDCEHLLVINHIAPEEAICPRCGKLFTQEIITELLRNRPIEDKL